MVKINNVAIFITFVTYGKNQFHFVHVLLKMHPTTDHDMKKTMLVQNFHEQHSSTFNCAAWCFIYHTNEQTDWLLSKFTLTCIMSETSLIYSHTSPIKL